MFNEYRDIIKYEPRLEQLDETGDKVYGEVSEIKARYIGGGTIEQFDETGNLVRVSKEYHIPSTVKVGDKLNGRPVLNVEVVVDIFGNFVYNIVKVGL